MCGIGLTLILVPATTAESSTTLREEIRNAVLKAIASRGGCQVPTVHRYDVSQPQQQRYLMSSSSSSHICDNDTIVNETAARYNCELTLFATVLPMRGNNSTCQPYRSILNQHHCFDLCWNGECYSYHSDSRNNDSLFDMALLSSADTVPSDTELVMKVLSDAMLQHPIERQQQHEAVAEACSRIHGEYSFILYSDKSCVYFGRDVLGRRSLLMSPLLRRGVNVNLDSFPAQIFTNTTTSALQSFVLSSVSLPLQHTLQSHHNDDASLNSFQEVVAGRIYRLDLTSFSLSYIAIPKWSHITPPLSCLHDTTIPKEVPPQHERIMAAAHGLHAYLNRAVRRRVLHAPMIPPTIIDNNNRRTSSSAVAVLFSGGLDSVVLAALAHNHVPIHQSIDLINVSFFSSTTTSSSSPDRMAALESYKELKKIYPTRTWCLIGVNINYTINVLAKEDRICRLIAPTSSTMDFNIGTAFWFASQGVGQLEEDEQEGNLKDLATPTTTAASSSSSIQEINDSSDRRRIMSVAKVLLVGIGADEQMAGYARHRSVFRSSGYEGLQLELEMEQSRLWTRNLGRDDRCLSDHGKEARFPYLDEDVVHYLQSLDIQDICDMSSISSLRGDKLILRYVAKKLGFHYCSGLVKRAIQFGSRIAKISDAHRFGSSRKAFGTSPHIR